MAGKVLLLLRTWQGLDHTAYPRRPSTTSSVGATMLPRSLAGPSLLLASTQMQRILTTILFCLIQITFN